MSILDNVTITLRGIADEVLGFRLVWVDTTELGEPQTAVFTPVMDGSEGVGRVTTGRLRPIHVPG